MTNWKKTRFALLVKQLRDDLVYYLDWAMPGFRAVAVHRFGSWALGINSRFFRTAMLRLHRIGYLYVRNRYTIDLPLTVTLGRGVQFAHQGAVIVHPLTRLGNHCIVRHKTTIGAPIGGATGGPILGTRVNVGCGAVIAAGVVIGDDVRIGPNAVVVQNVPAGASIIAPAPRVSRRNIPTTSKPPHCSDAGHNGVVSLAAAGPQSPCDP